MTTPPPQAPAFTPQWQDPADENAFWFRDVLHNPHPITPLNATMFQPAFSTGATRAIGKLSMPITAARASVHNGYVYLNTVPFVGSPTEMEARFAEMQRLTGELGATVLRDWREIFEPRVRAMGDEALAFDAASASLAQTAQFICGLRASLVEAWDIHMRVNIPPMNAMFGLEEFLGAVSGHDAIPRARQLLQGFPNKSVETGRALWDLGRWVRATPGLAEAVRDSVVRQGVVEVEHPAADEFQRRFREFLEAYGWRSDVFMEFGHPSWREDPSSPLVQLKSYIQKEDGEDPFAAHERQSADRPRLEAELEADLPEPVRPQFRALLALAQQYIPIAEDHNFTIDQGFTMVLRECLLRLGRKLVEAGIVTAPDDVFYLVDSEIEALAAGATGEGLSARVRERRRARSQQSAMRPPLEIGTPLPPGTPADPLVTKFFGYGPQPDSGPKTVTGHPSSAGSVTGIARVVHTLDEAHRIAPGDILVCPMTMPAWTPLFGVVSAVVSDSGGPLSHCAIVAREYGIPCVAGTNVGTTVIPDGARVVVDGTNGIVRVLD